MGREWMNPGLLWYNGSQRSGLFVSLGERSVKRFEEKSNGVSLVGHAFAADLWDQSFKNLRVLILKVFKDRIGKTGLYLI